ncbi:MAG: acetoin:2,6-dichlorophenolindophenol oxidoreductase subunit alpha [Acidobacteriota bacterium]|jgi:pyruvate dehydrogenase E1 component alpha subunit|nr:acetoin:2,6-dichlorophenolindophenol oxidoreductase subunit alpha [Acidobacteriota bacterium]
MTTFEVAVEPRVAQSLEAMLLIRAFEEQSAALNAAGKSPSMCTSIGQEASAVGVMNALDWRDQILTNHRSAGHLLARGADPRRILAEILGKSTGYCGGKSGSLHISVKELGVVLTSTIVGGELSLAPGVALSRQMLGGEGIVVVFFGDGAATEGVFHESINLAAVWNLPVLYVCENNQWQAFVHRKETMLADHISTWGASYGVKSLTVDGNDVDAVTAAAKDAVAYVRGSRKPFLLETYTYRLRGHMEPDPATYVDPAELQSWKERDPIATYEQRLLAEHAITPAELDAMKSRVRARIEDAAQFAMKSPYPSFEELTTNVYA